MRLINNDAAEKIDRKMGVRERERGGGVKPKTKQSIIIIYR